MTKTNFGEAFTAGLGLAMGLAMSQHIFQAMIIPEKIVRQVVICHECGWKNPAENKFCGHCGRALYPPPPIQCPKCKAVMPSKLIFCRSCSSPLKKNKPIKKRK